MALRYAKCVKRDVCICEQWRLYIKRDLRVSTVALRYAKFVKRDVYAYMNRRPIEIPIYMNKHDPRTTLAYSLGWCRQSTHCNTLQHTATHCNPLQHTATHCNTLAYSLGWCRQWLSYVKSDVHIWKGDLCRDPYTWMSKETYVCAEYRLFYRALLPNSLNVCTSLWPTTSCFWCM